MTVASEIARLQGVKANILDAIAAKGVTVPSGAKLADCPELIASISGGSEPISNNIGGRIYNTVIIGGKEWMAENLDFKFSGLVVGHSGTSASEPRGNYYNNSEAIYGVNGNKYGLLYNWPAVKYLEDNKSQLIPGWHVPTIDEWDALATAVGGTSFAGTKLKSTTDWAAGTGTDDYGFSAFPAGTYNGSFDFINLTSYFWTATESDSIFGFIRYFNPSADMFSTDEYKSNQYSVRLVKNIP